MMTFLTIRKRVINGVQAYIIRLKKPKTPEYIVFENGTWTCTMNKRCKPCLGMQNCIRNQLGLPMIQKPKWRVKRHGKV